MFYYLDQAATTALYPEALKAMMPYLTEAYGNPSSQHPKGQEAARALIMAREQAARALSVHPSEITFTGGGSESDNQALITCLLYTSPSPRDRQKSRMPSSA